MKNTYWRDEAACLSDIGGGEPRSRERSEERLKRLTLFIEKNCNGCPVAQECLDSSWFRDGAGFDVDDNLWTVRGGYLPTGLSVKPHGRPTGRWEPKSVPNGAPFTSHGKASLLERGMCSDGKHGILTEADLYISYSSGRANRVCRACRQAQQRRNHKRATKCGKGHPYTEESTINRTRSDGSLYRVCRTCTDEKRQLSEPKKDGSMVS